MFHFYICVGLVTREVVNMDVGLVGSLPLVIFWSSSHCYWQHLMPGWGNQDDNEWLQPCQGWYDDDNDDDGIIFGSFDTIASIGILSNWILKYWNIVKTVAIGSTSCLGGVIKIIAVKMTTSGYNHAKADMMMIMVMMELFLAVLTQ